MTDKNKCPKCDKCFTRLSTLKSHLEMKPDCLAKINKLVCNICQKKFCRKIYLDKHKQKHLNVSSKQLKVIKPVPIKLKMKTDDQSICVEIDTNDQSKAVDVFIMGHIIEQNQKLTELIGQQNQKIDQLIKKQNQLTEKQNQLTEKPSNIINNNNNLQIICIGTNDNYLDMLSERVGFDIALEYIKDCALSNLTGDCKLIDRIYINNSDSIHYIDKKKTKVEYFDENRNKIIDSLTNFGKKIANNLQNSYLKGVNHLVNETLDNHRCPNKFLEDYDLQTWNQHIYELSNFNYQKKIVNNLNILCK